MRIDDEGRNETVRRAREHLQDVMRQHSDDPRSQQLISEARRDAEEALRRATQEG